MDPLVQWLQSINPGDVGFGVLVTLAIVSVFTGRLVPRNTVEDIRADRDERITQARAEADDWKAAYLAEREARSQQSVHFSESLELSRTAVHLLQALRPEGR